MTSSVRVNLHCHSDLSDGQLPPEQVVQLLARDGVRFAALTDHDTVAGLARFREAAAHAGIGVASGVEIFATTRFGEAHLLAYGFDPESPDLRAILAAVPQGGRASLATAARMPAPPPRPLPAEEVCQIVHRAGGRVFLAHPLQLERDPEKLRVILLELKAAGLDGIEAIYAPYGADETKALLGLARDCGLLVCCGTDLHGPDIPRLSLPGVDMPRDLWERFRDSLFSASGPRASAAVPAAASPYRKPTRLARTSFILRILLPTLLAIGLLIVAVFTFIVPAFKDALLSRKREMIRELTNSAWSILAEYHEEEKAGRLTREQAEEAAVQRVRFLRYGKEGKDYFWITDMRPRMVMHPYRTDLNGKDVSDFSDPKGNRVFMEFLRVVRERNEGYVEYVWQWKDDPARLVPKQSYVRGFAPWGWVIGTGIYVEDVHAEISALTNRIVRISVVIAVVIALLLVFVAQQSFRIERRRGLAEDALRESHDRYRALVEASKEGMMMVLDGRPTYANQTLLALLGYSDSEWPLLEIDDIVAEGGGLPRASQWLAAATAEGKAPEPTETRLRKKDGTTIDALLTVEQMTLAEKPGFILIARDLSTHKGLLAVLDRSRSAFQSLAGNLRAAVFRTSLDRRMRVLETNPAADTLFGLPPGAGGPRPGLADLFADPEEFEAFRRELTGNGKVVTRVTHLRGPAGTVAVSLSAVLIRGERGDEGYCDAVAEEMGAGRRELSERDALIADLQTPLLSLNEPVRRFMRALPACDYRTDLARAAAIMAQNHASALLVTGPGGEGIGLLSDSDFCDRVVGRGLAVGRPVFEVMTAPLVAVSPTALGYEAILLMREKNVRHLAVRDEAGAVIGVVRNKELLEPERYPLALLSRAIRGAGRVEDLAQHRARLPLLAQGLADGGARPRSTCRAITAVSDAIAQRLLLLAEEELGPAPAPFAFIVLGSGGREEQTLVTDQDNAIIFDPPAGTDPAAAHAYFTAVGERVCDWLDRTGYPLCKGGMMAKNPRWCAPLAAWKEYFSGWINVAEPKDLLDFNTCFDFRCIHGDAGLAAALRQHTLSEIAHTPAFFAHLAQNALHHRSLLGFFGKIVAETDVHGSQRTFNIKEATAPIVSFARLYALRGGAAETNTFDRLGRLQDMGVLTRVTSEEISQAYQFLISLRLAHQMDSIRSGQVPTNHISIKALTQIEETLLKQIFSQIAAFQKKISFDFLGGEWAQGA